MRRAVALGSLITVTVLVLIGLHAPPEPAATGDSPAFETLLSQAIARLDGISQQVAATSIAATHAGPQVPTVDEYTCSGFRTCDALPTCDGNQTCDGEITCWNSTCLSAPTCQPTCEQYTTDGSSSCNGSSTCAEGCAGWPTYHAQTETCLDGATCELTCTGYVTCSGCPNAIERTTWGAIKAGFVD